MSKQFYLRDTRSNVGSSASFWGKASGYTTNLNEAEIFTEEEALRQHQCRETDLPVEVAFTVGKTRQRIDMQYVDNSPILFDSQQHIVIVRGEYDGNDLLFIGENGQTFEFNKAKVFSLEEACEFSAANRNCQIQNYDDIAAIIRVTVNAADVQPKACADFAGFTLNEPPKPRKTTYHCCGCGVFMSEYQFYATDCRKCGTSNRP